MRSPNLVVTAVSDRLVAMVALNTLDRLLGAHLSGDKDAFEDRFQESKALVLSERAQAMLNDFKTLGIK